MMDVPFIKEPVDWFLYDTDLRHERVNSKMQYCSENLDTQYLKIKWKLYRSSVQNKKMVKQKILNSSLEKMFYIETRLNYISQEHRLPLKRFPS